MDITASSDKCTVSNAVSSMFARMCCFHPNVALLRPFDSFWQKASRFFVIEQTRKLIVKYNPSNYFQFTPNSITATEVRRIARVQFLFLCSNKTQACQALDSSFLCFSCIWAFSTFIKVHFVLFWKGFPTLFPVRNTTKPINSRC